MAALVLLVAGCSSSGEEVAPTTVTSTSSSSTTSTTEPSTTGVATTTTSAEAEWTPEELEVVEAYEAFQAAWVTATTDFDRSLEQMALATTAEYLETHVQLFAGWRSNNQSLLGNRSFTIQQVTFAGPDAAVLEECGLASFEVVDSDGEVVTPGNSEPNEVVVFLVKEEGQWLVDGRQSGSSCSQ